MNIFENYLSKINKAILDNKDNLKLTILENLDNINLEVPPTHFNYDLSSNVSIIFIFFIILKETKKFQNFKNLIFMQIFIFT